MEKIYYQIGYKDLNFTQNILGILNFDKNIPVILCLGTRKVINDSLGPLVGTLLVSKYNALGYIYGTLEKPVTAKNAEKIYNFIKLKHSASQIIIIDSSVGNSQNFNTIKIVKPENESQNMMFLNSGIPAFNDCRITAVTASDTFEFMMQKSKLDMIGKMADVIAKSVNDALFLKILSQ